MFLVITSKRDGHVANVTAHLEAAGKAWLRLNTEDFARNCEVSVWPSRGDGRLTVLDSGRSTELRDIKGIWYRKPDPLNLSHFDLDSPSLEYVEAEFTEVLQGIYALLREAFWINDPLVARLSHRKLLQLRVASEVGFVVPRSLVTNRVDEAPDAVRSVHKARR
jgi:hypothetical protein